jgi:hypothetical protein
MPIPGGSPAEPFEVRTTVPVTCAGSSLPGSWNWRSTRVPSGCGVSLSTKRPPSLMLRANSEKNSSTVW